MQVCNFKTQHYGRSMLFIECFENTKRVFVLSIDKNVFFFRVLDTNNGIIYHRKYKFVNKICYLYLYWYEIWNSKKKCSFFILFIFLPKINRYDVFNFEKKNLKIATMIIQWCFMFHCNKEWQGISNCFKIWIRFYKETYIQ